MPVNPWRDLRAWQERLERLTAHHSESWSPPIDVYETADRYVVAAELPGLSRDQIELAMADSRLTIKGQRIEHTNESVHYHQVERGHGAFSRTFEFTEKIDVENVSADLANGILTVTLPKIPPAPRRKIDVR
jgi:HSP20 family protein